MTREELQFSISQYHGGTLAGAERVALEDRLAHDPEARQLLEAEQRLTKVLRSHPAPAVNWDRFAEHLSAQAAKQEAPRQSYRLFGVSPALVALAASIIIVAGIGVHLASRTSNPANPMGQAQAIMIRAVTPAVDPSPSEAPIGEIVVGPSKAVAGLPTLSHYADDVLSRPSHVILVRGDQAAQDTPALPY